jgi:PIN domain nuclease of toxin-antitoxin system
MAEYLLDTHACLYALAAPKKLGRRARRALDQADQKGHAVWLPAAVAAEVVILKELGRSELGLPALRTAFENSCWCFLPLDLRQIDEFAGLSAIRDPFDRLIVAAARSVGARLITRDATLAELGLVDIIWS